MKKPLSEMSLEELWQLFPIILKAHNPQHREWYLAQKDEIFHWVGQENIARINPIGSSMVEGLVAKPIVDILLEVPHTCDIEELKQRLTDGGWTLMSFQTEPHLNYTHAKTEFFAHYTKLARQEFPKRYKPEG